MKRLWILVPLFAVACEPSRRNGAEMHARDLEDVYTWHPTRQAEGFHAYDGLLGVGKDALPVLVQHLVDDRKTKIMDLADITVPTVGDVCFHILLRMFRMRPGDFRREGVVVLENVPNPIFSVRFDPGARKRVQLRFQKILEEQ